MAIGCGACFAKILVIAYNAIFLLTGLALIALGIWLIADGTITNFINLSFNGSNSTFFRNAAILLIAMGALILIVSVIGFLGAILENTILLGIYIALLIVIFCGEIAGGVVAIVYKDRIVYNLQTILSSSISGLVSENTTKPYYIQSANNTCQTSDTGYLWDFAQISLACCGVNAPSDYQLAFQESNTDSTYSFLSMCPNLNVASTWYPLSCYTFLNPLTTFGQFHTIPDNEYQAQRLIDFSVQPNQNGCLNQVTLYIQKYAPVLIGIGIGFAMLELYGILFAVCLCRNVSKEEDYCHCCFTCCDTCHDQGDECCSGCSAGGCGDGCCCCT
jgi:hypothetical protein